MGLSIFTDKKVRPTDAQVQEAVGVKLAIWQELIGFIRDKYPVQEDFKFLYGKNYGWGLRFRIKKQLLTSLYPAQGRFFAQVNLGPQAVEAAQRLPLGRNAQEAIERAHPYPEGRWLFIPVESVEDAGDIRQLLVLRVESKRLLP